MEDKVVCRRKSDPQVVVRTWSAITRAVKDGQPTDAECLLRYMNDEENAEWSEMEALVFNTQLQDALADDLLVQTEDGYSIPDLKDIKQDGHDWYCFLCHKSGNVVMCNTCWRVYHPLCILKQGKNTVSFVCNMCKKLQDNKKTVAPQLLAFVLLRLKNKTGPLHNLKVRSDPVHRTMPVLVYEMMDLDTIQSRIIDNHYSSIMQFEHDVVTILHNVAIIYGASSDITGLARVLLKDCRFELAELRQCVDCYYFSNLKPKNWFCYPCRPPHDLAYAKLRGYSYWPAKIITASQKGYNVRFFGTFHQRALIAEPYIKVIETERNEILPRKHSRSLEKALEELDLHQTMLKENSTFSMNLEPSEILQKTKSSQKRRLTSMSLDSLASDSQLEDISNSPVSDETVSAKSPVLKKLKMASKRSIPDIGSALKTSIEKTSKSLAAGISSSVPPVITQHQNHSRLMNDANLSPKNMHANEEHLSHIDYQEHPLLVNTNTSSGDEEVQSRTGRVMALDTSSMKYNREMIQLKMLTDYADCINREDPNETRQLFDELTANWCQEFQIKKNDPFFREIVDIQRTVEKIWKQAETRALAVVSEKMKSMEECFRKDISENKKRQWCYYCENPAQYYCCWNTSYCSLHCQREHWQSEHRHVCRRVNRNQSANSRMIVATDSQASRVSRPVNGS